MYIVAAFVDDRRSQRWVGRRCLWARAEVRSRADGPRRGCRVNQAGCQNVITEVSSGGFQARREQSDVATRGRQAVRNRPCRRNRWKLPTHGVGFFQSSPRASALKQTQRLSPFANAGSRAREFGRHRKMRPLPLGRKHGRRARPSASGSQSAPNPQDPKRGARTFVLALTRPMGVKRDSFVQDTTAQTVAFYRDLVQNPKPWQPPAPRITRPDPEPDADISDAKPVPLPGSDGSPESTTAAGGATEPRPTRGDCRSNLECARER